MKKLNFFIVKLLLILIKNRFRWSLQKSIEFINGSKSNLDINIKYFVWMQ